MYLLIAIFTNDVEFIFILAGGVQVTHNGISEHSPKRASKGKTYIYRFFTFTSSSGCVAPDILVPCNSLNAYNDIFTF